MPATLNLTALTNETFQFSVVWQQTLQGQTELVNILSWNARMQVRAFYDSATPLIDVGTSGLSLSGITIDGISATISVSVPYDVLTTIGAGEYVYDMVAVDPISGNTYAIIGGTFTIQQGVTDPNFSVSNNGTGSSGNNSSGGSLSATGVAPGTYTLSTISVNPYGEIVYASNGTLTSTGVNPGQYLSPNLTISADGRITTASNGTIANTGVTAGNYSRGALLTIGADGRITSASTGNCYEPGDNIFAADSSILLDAQNKVLEANSWLSSGNALIEFGSSNSSTLSVVMNNGVATNQMLGIGSLGVTAPQVKEAAQLINLTGAINFDLSKLSTISGTVTPGSALVISFSNYSAGYTAKAQLVITNGAAASSISYGHGNSAVKWPGGIPPVLTSGVDFLTFFTADGENWLGNSRLNNQAALGQ